ncbi:hypothetical protein PSCICO_33720 [Pseudomonas cichorii]|uniref:AAA family ATPase n=1 Tax=Pseudomonas cichorii TaxID=36746 RepID=UPI00190FCAA5|nr:AAA family ATPase [Pseudomonas cichorii]GFM87973.1 hypothetical protein PSCICO_33720 [Pseudomonas cichorii]
MILLKAVKVHKYKSIQATQEVDIDEKVTTVVGMNESGKTSFLTCLAKTNYFSEDKDFVFDAVHDYPRSEYIDYQHTGEPGQAVTCTYVVSDELAGMIADDVGVKSFTEKEFKVTYNYDGAVNLYEGVSGDISEFISHSVEALELSSETLGAIKKIKKLTELSDIQGGDQDAGLETLKARIKLILDSSFNSSWRGELGAYIACHWLKPRLPKYWYFDEYYPLSGEINISQLETTPKGEQQKTALALFEMARIKPAEVLKSSTQDYERYVAMLEASSNKVSKEMFKYWSTNANLDFDFKIKDVPIQNGGAQKYLDVRVKSQRHKISLPLDRRSKGFNWFFSFIVWFSKIQSDKNSNYVLLLDEPGLNLHASAQADLLRFIEDLSETYQVIYTTHSPFMINTKSLNRVRTCFETDEGTVISDSIQEKDPKTLFPLQAALGYDIAQNLFVSSSNLLVEGPADLIYLTVLSSHLESKGRKYLNPEITIVPVGGLDKVSTFISLLRGSKLKVACLLDTFTDQRGKRKVDDLIADKIIKKTHVRFFDEFSPASLTVSDIEDLFDVTEYLNFFNTAFTGEIDALTDAMLPQEGGPILKRINKAISRDRFNHYRPANALNSMKISDTTFSAETLGRFEKVFEEINKLFQ